MEIVRDRIEFFLFFSAGKILRRRRRIVEAGSLCEEEKFAAVIAFFILLAGPNVKVVVCPSLAGSWASSCIHFVEHISRSSRRQSISGSFSYQIVFAGGQSQVTDALARSTSISRSIYEAVEQVLRASQLASFFVVVEKSISFYLFF